MAPLLISILVGIILFMAKFIVPNGDMQVLGIDDFYIREFCGLFAWFIVIVVALTLIWTPHPARSMRGLRNIFAGTFLIGTTSLLPFSVSAIETQYGIVEGGNFTWAMAFVILFSGIFAIDAERTYRKIYERVYGDTGK